MYILDINGTNIMKVALIAPASIRNGWTLCRVIRLNHLVMPSPWGELVLVPFPH